MKKVFVFIMILFVSMLWSGIALADCHSNCDAQLQTCDQGCQYIKDDNARLRCQNRCLSGYFHCLKRCDGRSEITIEKDTMLCSDDFGVIDNEEIAPTKVTVTGELVQMFAIGGETTGWAIKLDQPLKVESKELNLIEIDLMGKKINILPFVGERVEVTGKLVKRHGIERGDYWVIEVREFSW